MLVPGFDLEVEQKGKYLCFCCIEIIQKVVVTLPAQSEWWRLFPHTTYVLLSLSLSLSSHGCFRNLIDFFEIRCCGLIRPVTVDWTTQYTIEYDQTSGSGYQLV